MLSILGINSASNISFKRALKSYEKSDYAQTIQDAKSYLGIENLALVMHGSSFPVNDNDLFIGSATREKASEVNDFLKLHGFDSVQLGPPGAILKPDMKSQGFQDYSPYKSSINSKNYLFCDMKKLIGYEYANILKLSDIEKETSLTYEKSSDMTDFKRAFEAYDRLFENAYDNLNKRNDKSASILKQEFREFKDNSKKWLKTDSMFNLLQEKYETSNIDNWSELDKNLIKFLSDKNSPNHQDAVKRYKELINDKQNQKTIDLYKFKQFITEKQEKDFLQTNPNKLEYISDAIIGFSAMDMWGNPDAFLTDYRVGAPQGGGCGIPDENGKGVSQTWDIPLISPKKLFKEDGSLDVGGKLLRQKFENLLDTYQNIRIDHVFGLIDPWIYNKNDVETKYDSTGKIIYNEANGALLSKIDKEGSKNYSKILEKILLPLLKEKGLTPNKVIWENLGDDSSPVYQQIYNKDLKLPSMTVLQWDRAEGKSRDNWMLISSHDEPPFSKVCAQACLDDNGHEIKNSEGLEIKNDFFDNHKIWAMNPLYLIGFLFPEKKNEEKDKLINNLNWDTRLRVTSKYQELFRCASQAQVSFMDFFGLTKTYNKKGISDSDNWKLRLTKDYEAKYYQTLEEKNWRKPALNMPEILERAVISKAVHQGEISGEKELINKLNHYKKVLYEKTEE